MSDGLLLVASGDDTGSLVDLVVLAPILSPDKISVVDMDCGASNDDVSPAREEGCANDIVSLSDTLALLCVVSTLPVDVDDGTEGTFEDDGLADIDFDDDDSVTPGPSGVVGVAMIIVPGAVPTGAMIDIVVG